MSRTTARDKAIEAVRAAEAQLAHWQAEEIAKAAELSSLQARVGDEVLSDPERAASLSADLADASAAVEIAQRAAQAARPKVDEAERIVWDLDAARLEREAAAAQAKLDAHKAKTDGLLVQLREHEGDFVPAKIQHQLGAVPHGMALDQPSPMKSWLLQTEVSRLTLRAQVLRDRLAGVDPLIRLEELSSRDVVSAQVYGLPKSAYLARSTRDDELIEA